MKAAAPIAGMLALATVLGGGVPAAADLAKEAFGRHLSASAGAPAAIGSYARGCLAGGAQLPETGPAWQAMRLSRNRNWGHPEMIGFLQRLSGEAQRAGWPRILVGDISQPRGGPMLSGHNSHQIGLDADVWLRRPDARLYDRNERERISSHIVVTGGRVNGLWTPSHHAVLRAAARDRAVARIFVNPAIKLALCEAETGDRAWLRKIRPWRGHDAHFHVRLACPGGAPGCIDQPPPPAGDGCGADLDRWLPDRAAGVRRTGNRTPPGGELTLEDLPAVCLAVDAGDAAPAGALALGAAYLDGLPVFLEEEDTAYEGFVGTRYFWVPEVDRVAATARGVRLATGPLPPGLEFRDRGGGNGLLTGIPTEAGDYIVEVRALAGGQEQSRQRVSLSIADLARTVPPPEDGKALAARVDRFIDDFVGSGCFLARPETVTPEVIRIEAFGFTPEPFYEFDEAFKAAIGTEARIGGRTIAPNHCEAIAFVRALAHSDRPEPSVSVARAEFDRGGTLSAEVSVASGARPVAVLVDDFGYVWDLPVTAAGAGWRIDARINQPGLYLAVVVDPVEPVDYAAGLGAGATASAFRLLDGQNHLGNLGMSARAVLVRVR